MHHGHLFEVVWLVLWILPALKTRAQCNSNNHLTGGTVDKREAVMPNWGFWGNLGSPRNGQPLSRYSTPHSTVPFSLLHACS